MAADQSVERLTPLDLLMPAGYVGALLVFPTTKSSHAILNSLQTGLDRVCERIPWIKGHLFPSSTIKDQKPGLEIRWSPKDTDLRIVDKGDISEAYEELAKALIPLKSIPTHVWPAPSNPVAGAPAFAASFFRFGDNKAVGLCIQGHHNAVDGFGFSEIVHLWARCMAGPESQPPNDVFSLDRARILAKAIGQESNATAFPSVAELFDKHPEHSRNPPVMPTVFSACNSEILIIPMDKIEALKKDLASFLPTTPTTNTVACALIWSAVTRARIRRDPDLANKTSQAPMAVNGRKRVDLALANRPHPYLGNLVVFSLAEMSARDLSASGQDGATEILADVCRVIANAQSRDHVNAAHITEVHQLFENVEDYRGIFPGWELFGSRDLFITNWADLDMYEQDFGGDLGTPRFVRLPYAQADGNVIILPRKRNSADNALGESLEAVIMLQEDDLKALKEDPLWRTS